MNKTFQRIFAKAKSENKSCFVGFVTGMDPDYESSKQILIELSKYCSVLEIGVSFNTSTSDSSIIMSANDRAIKSGAKTEKIFQLIKDVKREITSDTAFVTMGYLNQIHVYGIDRYIEDCKKSGVDGCIVVDSNNEAPEDDQIFKGLTKNNMAFIKLIAPTNDINYIKHPSEYFTFINSRNVVFTTYNYHNIILSFGFLLSFLYFNNKKNSFWIHALIICCYFISIFQEAGRAGQILIICYK